MAVGKVSFDDCPVLTLSLGCTGDLPPSLPHIAAVLELEEHLLPQAEALVAAIEAKSNKFSDVVMTGRMHLQDAVPLDGGAGMVGLRPANP
jgi:fumarate hydratase class II